MPLLETCQDQTSCDEALVLDRKYLFNDFFRDGGGYAFLDELPAKAPCAERPGFHSLTAPLLRKTAIVDIAQFGQVVQGDPDCFLGMTALLETGTDVFPGARSPGREADRHPIWRIQRCRQARIPRQEIRKGRAFDVVGQGV